MCIEDPFANLAQVVAGRGDDSTFDGVWEVFFVVFYC